jgi:hypothetical protein
MPPPETNTDDAEPFASKFSVRPEIVALEIRPPRGNRFDACTEHRDFGGVAEYRAQNLQRAARGNSNEGDETRFHNQAGEKAGAVASTTHASADWR